MQSLPWDTWEGFLSRTILSKFEGSRLDCMKEVSYSWLPAVWAIWLIEQKQEAPPRKWTWEFMSVILKVWEMHPLNSQGATPFSQTRAFLTTSTRYSRKGHVCVLARSCFRNSQCMQCSCVQIMLKVKCVIHWPLHYLPGQPTKNFFRNHANTLS